MNTFLLAGNYLATAAVCLLCWRKRPFRMLDPAWAFLGGYFINYCVRPALFLINPELGSAYSGMFDPLMRPGFAGAILFAAVGLSGFAVGNLAFPKTAQKLADVLPTSGRPNPSEERFLLWISFTLLAAGCFGLYAFVSDVGWAGTLLELLQGGERDALMAAMSGHGLYLFGAQLSLLGWATVCIYWLTSPAPARPGARMVRRLSQFAWFAVTLGIWVAFGTRAAILAVVFAPVALRNTLKKRWPRVLHHNQRLKLSRTTPLVLAALSFTVAGPVGLMMKGGEISPGTAVNMSISAWDSFEFTVAAQHRLRARDLFWGTTYGEDLIYTWLPRGLFPWKPQHYGIVRAQDLVAPELAESNSATFPPGILVEAFCNFGYVGLFLIPLLIGIVCRAIYHHLVRLDWLWLVLMAISFTNLASFRGFGGFAAVLLANGAIAYTTLVAGRAAQSLSFALATWQPHSQP
jgi:hypothetical protein